jgi:hypothetical protein
LGITIDIQQRGLNIQLFADKVDAEVLPNVIQQLVDYGYADMMSRVPFRTGTLMGSIQSEASGLQGYIGPTVPYAVYVEYGTMPHEIRPMYAHVLRFVIGTKVIFTPLVHHPGTRAQPFIEETVQDIVAQMPEIWKQAFDQAVVQ